MNIVVTLSCDIFSRHSGPFLVILLKRHFLPMRCCFTCKFYNFRESYEEANLWTQLQRDHCLSVGPGASQASGDCGWAETIACLLDLEQVRHQMIVDGLTIEKVVYKAHVFSLFCIRFVLLVKLNWNQST